MEYIVRGSAAFRKTNIALFAGGFSTFAVLYSTQPLLPYLSEEFGVSAATASLSLSAATIALAVGLLFAGSLSEAKGRKPIMTASLFSASILAILAGFAPGFHTLLTLRILQGLALSGLSAIAMAYLGEEMEAGSLGAAMGMFISGNSLGGMFGRIIIGLLTDWVGWRPALSSVGVLSLLSSILFVAMLPPSKHFHSRPLQFGKLAKTLLSHLRDTRMLSLFGIGALMLGSNVALYNYIGYQLIAPPYNLPATLVSFIFILYLSGTVSSALLGHLADRHGRQRVLWAALAVMLAGILITLAAPLALKILGIAMLTFGFFGGHSVASSWVGALASHDKAQASSLYLFFYYGGSSIAGTAGGFFWEGHGWGGVVAMIACFVCIAGLLSIRLYFQRPESTKNETDRCI